METLVIGKPAINVYIPLEEFPNEGDVFSVTGKSETLGNVAATTACLLSKWGMHAHFTGVVGNDAYAEKIRESFKEHKVNAKYMETQFESGTSVNYIVLNSKTGYVTKILYNNPEAQLAKFKYDFTPDAAVMDGTDLAGSRAFLNNSKGHKAILFARIADKELINLSKSCSYVVCTQAFASGMTKVILDGSKEQYFELYQKIVDTCGHSNYVVILDNHKILYSKNAEVKLLPEMKINVADYSSFESIFTGTFSFGILNGLNIDDAIKLANTSAAISLSKIGEVPAIPTIDEVLDNTGLRDKLLQAKAALDASKEEAAIVKAPTSVGVSGVNPQQIAEKQAAQSSESSQPAQESPAQPSAFDLAPTASEPVQNTVSPQPVSMPEPKVETNMFDNPTNV